MHLAANLARCRGGIRPLGRSRSTQALEEPVDRRGMSEHESRHEAEDEIVDLAVLGDRQLGSATRGAMR